MDAGRFSHLDHFCYSLSPVNAVHEQA